MHAHNNLELQYKQGHAGSAIIMVVGKEVSDSAL